MNKLKICLMGLVVILLSLGLSMRSYIAKGANHSPQTGEHAQQTTVEESTYKESEKAQEVLDLISNLKEKQREIDTLETEIMDAITERNSTKVYTKADKLNYVCQQLLEMDFDATTSEYFEYISCFKGYAEAGIKWATNLKSKSGKAEWSDMETYGDMAEFSLAIGDFEELTINPLIDRKGLREENKKLIEMLIAGEDITQATKQFWTKINEATDLTAFERLLVEDELAE